MEDVAQPRVRGGPGKCRGGPAKCRDGPAKFREGLAKCKGGPAKCRGPNQLKQSLANSRVGPACHKVQLGIGIAQAGIKERKVIGWVAQLAIWWLAQPAICLAQPAL